MSDDAERETARDTGPPDAFMLAAHERQRRRMRNRLRISVPLALLSLPAAVVVWLASDWPWLWIVVGELGALCLVGTVNLIGSSEPERPRPTTPLEAAVVVGVEILTWAHARGTRHTARIIGRPFGSTSGQLVHGTYEYSSETGCHIRPGMLFGFRRHPTMRHLVQIELLGDARALQRLRQGPLAGHLQEAVVETVTIGDDHDGDWWATTVTVRAGDARLVDTRARLPEELAQFEPGKSVRILQDDSSASSRTCTILPEAL
ncbi:hypothetical protein [Streptomyces sp. TP-A0874]|uniref:hypothetical protein n=1 Tax=Streptomyces sp. TP-A0874 TaxID=549819 RepID=UPI00085297EF|nr:hypothetical protein [Streptomyces sp. TP-A0874]